MAEKSARNRFKLNDALVDPDALNLACDNSLITVEPKVMAVLTALAERPGSTWRRDDLVDRIWPDGSGGDESLTRAIYVLRKALAQLDMDDVIVTVPRLGYRLNAAIKLVDFRAPPPLPNTDPSPFSIAVLPFADQSASAENAWLTQGLVSDLSALLAKIPRFSVAPVSSVNHHAATEMDLTGLAHELNVRFAVKGSFARRDDDIRIRIELLEADGGSLLWARRYDTKLDRFYEVQDDAVLSIATAISTEIRTPRTAFPNRNKSFNLSAYELIQEAETLRQNYGEDTAATITEKLEAALSLDPDDPAVAAALAIQLSQNIVSRWSTDPGETKKRADALVVKAVADAPHDSDVLTAAGVVAAMLHRPDDAIDYLERSFFINPNDAHAIAVLGWQRCLRDGDPNGVTLLRTAEARAPHHPRFALWATYRATAHLFMAEYRQGLAAAREAVVRTPNYYQPLLHSAWAQAGLGDDEAAMASIARANALKQDVLAGYVDEMRMWSDNSKFREENHRTLSRLPALGERAALICIRIS